MLSVTNYSYIVTAHFYGIHTFSTARLQQNGLADGFSYSAAVKESTLQKGVYIPVRVMVSVRVSSMFPLRLVVVDCRYWKD